MNCVCCGSAAVTERPEVTARGYRRFRCRTCGRQFNERSGGVLNRTCLPSDIIAFVVFCRLRYRLTLRDLSEIMALRGIEVTYEAVRDWEAKLLPVMGDALRKRRHGTRRGPSISWHVDETYLKVRGRWTYLYRAIDRDGNLVDAMLSEHRDMKAAKAFFRSARAIMGFQPHRVTTDGHGSYPRAIRTVLGKTVRHRTSAYLNYVGPTSDWSRRRVVRCGERSRDDGKPLGSVDGRRRCRRGACLGGVGRGHGALRPAECCRAVPRRACCRWYWRRSERRRAEGRSGQ